MHPISSTIAVTGMNATDNPAPGVAVVRSLRHESAFSGRVVGLGYDNLDPGFYADGLLDGGGILPFPSAGRQAFLERILAFKRAFGMDVLLPTLDSELRAVSALESELHKAGINTFVPRPDSIERASKAQLHKLADHAGVTVPGSEAIMSVDGVTDAIKEFGLPIVIKGVYYGAAVVYSEADALAAFHRFVASWGVPVIAQRFVAGEEYNVAAIGDGAGGLAGAVAMRKMALTDKGKGWSGVTVDNPALLHLTAAVVAALSWRGPLEVEILRDHKTGELFVVEINPRFPAWIYLSAGAGQNLPYLCTLLALGLPLPAEIPPYKPGTLFVRISLDQISDLSTFEALTASGTMRTNKVPQ